jgi:hypothetical protein
VTGRWPGKKGRNELLCLLGLHFARTEVLAMVLLKILVFWDVILLAGE